MNGKLAEFIWSLRRQREVMRVEQEPFCWSPVGDASSSSPPSGSVQVVEVVKAASLRAPEGLGLDKLNSLCYSAANLEMLKG